MSRRNNRSDDRYEDEEREEREEREEERGGRDRERHGRHRHHRHHSSSSNSTWTNNSSLVAVVGVGILTLLAAVVGLAVVSNTRMNLDATMTAAVSKHRKDCYERRLFPYVDMEQGVFVCVKEIDTIHSIR